MFKKLVLAAVAAAALVTGPVVVAPDAAPQAQAAINPDLINWDDRYSVHAVDSFQIGRYYPPGAGSSSANLLRVSVPVNMCYDYTMSNAATGSSYRRTACGNTQGVINMGTPDRIRIHNAWLR
jgi:hypothetical protein